MSIQHGPGTLRRLEQDIQKNELKKKQDNICSETANKIKTIAEDLEKATPEVRSLTNTVYESCQNFLTTKTKLFQDLQKFEEMGVKLEKLVQDTENAAFKTIKEYEQKLTDANKKIEEIEKGYEQKLTDANKIIAELKSSKEQSNRTRCQSIVKKLEEIFSKAKSLNSTKKTSQIGNDLLFDEWRKQADKNMKKIEEVVSKSPNDAELLKLQLGAKEWKRNIDKELTDATKKITELQESNKESNSKSCEISSEKKNSLEIINTRLKQIFFEARLHGDDKKTFQIKDFLSLSNLKEEADTEIKKAEGIILDLLSNQGLWKSMAGPIEYRNRINDKWAYAKGKIAELNIGNEKSNCTPCQSIDKNLEKIYLKAKELCRTDTKTFHIGGDLLLKEWREQADTYMKDIVEAVLKSPNDEELLKSQSLAVKWKDLIDAQKISIQFAFAPEPTSGSEKYVTHMMKELTKLFGDLFNCNEKGKASSIYLYFKFVEIRDVENWKQDFYDHIKKVHQYQNKKFIGIILKAKSSGKSRDNIRPLISDVAYIERVNPPVDQIFTFFYDYEGIEFDKLANSRLEEIKRLMLIHQREIAENPEFYSSKYFE